MDVKIIETKDQPIKIVFTPQIYSLNEKPGKFFYIGVLYFLLTLFVFFLVRKDPSDYVLFYVLLALSLFLIIVSVILQRKMKMTYLLDLDTQILSIPDNTVFPLENTKAIIVNRKFEVRAKKSSSLRLSKDIDSQVPPSQTYSVPIWEVIIAKSNSGFSILKIVGKYATDNSYRPVFKFAEYLAKTLNVTIIDNTGNIPFEYIHHNGSTQRTNKRERPVSLLKSFKYKDFLASEKNLFKFVTTKNHAQKLKIYFSYRNPARGKIVGTILFFEIFQSILLYTQYLKQGFSQSFYTNVIVFVLVTLAMVLIVAFLPFNLFNVKNIVRVSPDNSLVIKKINGFGWRTHKTRTDLILQVNSLDLNTGHYLVELITSDKKRLFLSPFFDREGSKIAKTLIEELVFS